MCKVAGDVVACSFPFLHSGRKSAKEAFRFALPTSQLGYFLSTPIHSPADEHAAPPLNPAFASPAARFALAGLLHEIHAMESGEGVS